MSETEATRAALQRYSDLALEMAIGQLSRSGHWPERLRSLISERKRRKAVYR